MLIIDRVSLLRSLSYAPTSLLQRFGRTTLDSIRVGTWISNITKSGLNDCVVFLPDLAAQLDTLAELNKINSIESNVRALKSKLWKFPKSLPSIKKALKQYEQKDTFKDWIDTLPFPFVDLPENNTNLKLTKFELL